MDSIRSERWVVLMAGTACGGGSTSEQKACGSNASSTTMNACGGGRSKH